MRLYGLKMHNFMRYGEVDNTVVFDITEDQKKQIQKGKLTFDSLYSLLEKNPVEYISEVNGSDANVLKGIIGIAGMTGGSLDASNGAGKSTMFEAIAYAFYDKIVRQTANNDKKAPAGLSVVTVFEGVYPANLKESYVEVFFEEDERIYRLKRGRSFSANQKSNSAIFDFDCILDNEIDKLSGHRKRDTKKSLEEVIVEDYDIFVNTVMFGQNDAGKFLTGTDKVKKDMIIQLLKLENAVTGCMEVIRTKKKNQNDLILPLKSKIDSKKTICEKLCLKIIPEKLIPYSEKMYDEIQELAKEKKLNIKKIDTQLQEERETLLVNKRGIENSDTLKQIEIVINEGKVIAKEKEEVISAKQSSLKEWKDMIQSQESEKSSKISEISKLKSNIQISKDKLNIANTKLSTFNSDTCELQIEKCKKAISLEDSYNAKLKEISLSRDGLIKRIAEQDNTILSKTKEVSKLQKSLSGAGDKFVCVECQSLVTKEHINNKIQEAESVVGESSSTKSSLTQELEAVSEHKKVAESRISAIANYKVSYQQLLNEKESVKSCQESIALLQGSIDTYSNMLTESENGKETIDKKIVLLQQKISDIEKEFSAKIEKIDNILQQKRILLAELKSSSESLTLMIKEIDLKIEDLNKKINSGNIQIGALDSELENIKNIFNEIVVDQNKLVEENLTLQRLLILEDAFGLDGVQTRIVEKYLPLLNLYIKQFLDILSDGKMSVLFSISNRSKIDMEISGGTADTYIMLSGGEKMIVRLAVDIGLSLLSFSRTAKKPDMICLDEIFGPLDKDYTKCVFGMLQKLNDKFSRVFVISHKPEIQELITNNIIVEKDSGVRGFSKIKNIKEIA